MTLLGLCGGCFGRKEKIPEMYLVPQGLYAGSDRLDLRRLRKLIITKQLAPCFPAIDEPQPGQELEECPICFLHYPLLNTSRCCAKRVCTECFLQVQTTTQPNHVPVCPFCKEVGYTARLLGAKSEADKQQERLEEQKVIEARIREREEEARRDQERALQRLQQQEQQQTAQAAGTTDAASGTAAGAAEQAIVPPQRPDSATPSSAPVDPQSSFQLQQQQRQSGNGGMQEQPTEATSTLDSRIGTREEQDTSTRPPWQAMQTAQQRRAAAASLHTPYSPEPQPRARVANRRYRLTDYVPAGVVDIALGLEDINELMLEQALYDSLRQQAEADEELARSTQMNEDSSFTFNAATADQPAGQASTSAAAVVGQAALPSNAADATDTAQGRTSGSESSDPFAQYPEPTTELDEVDLVSIRSRHAGTEAEPSPQVLQQDDQQDHAGRRSELGRSNIVPTRGEAPSAGDSLHASTSMPRCLSSTTTAAAQDSPEPSTGPSALAPSPSDVPTLQSSQGDASPSAMDSDPVSDANAVVMQRIGSERTVGSAIESELSRLTLSTSPPLSHCGKAGWGEAANPLFDMSPCSSTTTSFAHTHRRSQDEHAPAGPGMSHLRPVDGAAGSSRLAMCSPDGVHAGAFRSSAGGLPGGSPPSGLSPAAAMGCSKVAQDAQQEWPSKDAAAGLADGCAGSPKRSSGGSSAIPLPLSPVVLTPSLKPGRLAPTSEHSHSDTAYGDECGAEGASSAAEDEATSSKACGSNAATPGSHRVGSSPGLASVDTVAAATKSITLGQLVADVALSTSAVTAAVQATNYVCMMVVMHVPASSGTAAAAALVENPDGSLQVVTPEGHGTRPAGVTAAGGQGLAGTTAAELAAAAAAAAAAAHEAQLLASEAEVAEAEYADYDLACDFGEALTDAAHPPTAEAVQGLAARIMLDDIRVQALLGADDAAVSGHMATADRELLERIAACDSRLKAAIGAADRT